jgi:hypothetical protein
MDVEMDRMLLRLKLMERDLGVPEDERISGG